MEIMILIKLFLAHILTDFVFQPSSWIENKKKFKFHFWLHSFLAGFLTYILLADWTCLGVSFFIMVTHAIIDAVKIKVSENKTEEQKRILFFIDQLFHLIILLIVWLYLIDAYDKIIPFIVTVFNDNKILPVLVAFILITTPVGIIIGKITEPFRKELGNNNDSLTKAGQYIGITERILILIFVLLGQYAAIGFLIAGKSILRVAKEGEDKGRKKTEYILIGTLISFTMSIVVGLLVKVII